MKNVMMIFVPVVLFVVLSTGFWGEVSGNVFPNSTWGLYSRDFFADLLQSMHGNLIDLLMVGIVLAWFERRRDSRAVELQKKIRIEERKRDLVRELKDMASYRGADASYRNLSNLRHLSEIESSAISVPNIRLSDVDASDLALRKVNLPGGDFARSNFKSVDFSGANLEGSNFSGAHLRNATLSGTRLSRCNFSGSKLDGQDFRGSTVQRARFKNASLRSANFSGCDCTGIDFDGADLSGANFLRCTGLKPGALDVARSTKGLKQ